MNSGKSILNLLFSIMLFLVLSSMALATEYKEVRAEDILKQIESHEDINLDKCRIVGNLNLNQIELETFPNPKYNYYDIYTTNVRKDLKIIRNNIRITDSILENDLDFSDTVFKESLCLYGCTFFGRTEFAFANFTDADFSGASFGGYADFSGASFGNNARFGDASFKDNASFSDTSFGGYADFDDASFGGYARFDDASFGDAAYFDNASFGGYADFSGASFGDAAYFHSAPFGDAAYFDSASFGDAAYFDNASFGGYADFYNASFGDDAEFCGASFGGYARFYDASFGGDADFSDTCFGGYADFDDASFSGIFRFYPACLNELYLNYTTFNNIEVQWTDLEKSLEGNDRTYLLLIQNFRNNGQHEDANSAYYQYRQKIRERKSWFSYSKWEDLFVWWICGYGVKPFYSIRFGAMVILFFSLIYANGPNIYWNKYPRIYFEGPLIRKLKMKTIGESQKPSFMDSLFFSIVTFFTLGYGDWYPKDNIRLLIMIEATLGWLTLGMFMATFINVTIR